MSRKSQSPDPQIPADAVPADRVPADRVHADRAPLSRRGLLGTALAGAAAGLVTPSTSARPAPATIPDGIQMRSSDPGLAPGPEKGVGGPPLPSLAIIALNRMGFGPRPGDVADFLALGADDTSRMNAYIAQQLDPDTISDTQLDNRMALANFASIGISDNPNTYLATLWDWYINNNAPNGETSSGVPHDELIRAKFLRAMFSKKQLVEVLAEFWHDHFNVNISDSSFVRATLPHLDLVIRQNLMGNFRELLEAVTRSTAMLYYLDNYTSSAAGPNENFCRELFELHTLGAENYLGVLQQNQVPTDGNGKPIGYVDADVFEATRCLTGWSISNGNGADGDTGLFYYRADWHDRFQKNVLGTFIPQDQADLQDGLDVLDALASHPGTGRHIARKLCRKFISDDPPQSLIDTVAGIFTTQWQAPDQLKQVYQAILQSPEFASTWGEKVKRPFHVVVSAFRATTTAFTPQDSSDTSSFLWRFDDTGHEPFHWPAPNGYPDVTDAWSSMSPMVNVWRLVGWMIDFQNSSDVHYIDVVGDTPAGVRSTNELVDHWIVKVLNRQMLSSDRQILVNFMSQGINPDFDLDLTDENTADRLRSLVGLIFMSPDFLWR